MSLSVDQLRQLGMQIANDPESVRDLSTEDTVALRNFLNPYGGVVTSKKSFANMSIINWRDKYHKRMITTGLIAYMYRMLSEYTDDAELDRENARHTAALVGVTDDTVIAAENANHAARVAAIKAAVSTVVGRFLDRNFRYNPDRHLRGSHTSNPSDTERREKVAAIREQKEAAAAAPVIEDKLRGKAEMLYQYMRSNTLATHATATELLAVTNSIIGAVRDPSLSVDDLQGILLKKYDMLSATVEDMGKIANPLTAADTLDAWVIEPPVDVFHQFDRFMTNHYTQLQDVVLALYNEKSDFEFSVIFYDAFKTAEAAREYRIQHEGEFKADVITVENSGVTLLGAFKENTSRVDYYNKHTEIMKRMMEQLESDHKLGGDFMNKQVKSQKRKNINEAGPDAPGLAAYSKAMNTVKDLGARKGLSKEEIEQLATAKQAAQEIRDDYETPDDAIQVDMLFPKVHPDGTTTLERTKFYTQAEAPTFMQDQSTMGEAYQPKREDDEDLETAYRTKTIVDRHGHTREIKVPTTRK
jgi:hypothetical protein